MGAQSLSSSWSVTIALAGVSLPVGQDKHEVVEESSFGWYEFSGQLVHIFSVSE